MINTQKIIKYGGYIDLSDYELEEGMPLAPFR